MIAENLAYFSNGSINAVVSIEKSVLAPDPLDDLLARDQLVSMLEQECQDLHRNALKFERTSRAAELISLQVELELSPKANRSLNPDCPRYQVAPPTRNLIPAVYCLCTAPDWRRAIKMTAILHLMQLFRSISRTFNHLTRHKSLRPATDVRY
jgi:hypothetical protein